MTTPQPIKGYRRARQALWMIVASYGIDSLLLVGFVVLNVVPAWVPAAYGACGLLHGLLFGAALRLNLTAANGDVAMPLVQTLFACAIQLTFLWLAPAAGLLFVSVMFVVAGFGAVSLDRTQIRVLLASVAIGLIGVMLSDTGFYPMAPRLTTERLLYALVLVCGLGRCLSLGLWTSSMRLSLSRKNQQLAETLLQVDRLATMDSLTDTLNRRSLIEAVESAAGSRCVAGAPLCVAMLDIDHFKSVNDRFGHLTGDRVLKQFAAVVTAQLRSVDTVGRYGGEEFVIILRDASVATAGAALDRVRKAVAEYDWDSIAPGLSLTVSIGATHQRGGDSPDLLLGRADIALYEAKRGGRDRVELASVA